MLFSNACAGVPQENGDALQRDALQEEFDSERMPESVRRAIQDTRSEEDAIQFSAPDLGGHIYIA
jgi:hypothetical protein